jgi:hypothetical protein
MNVGGVDYKKVIKLDDSLRIALYERNSLDVELYRHWQSRLPESVAAIN